MSYLTRFTTPSGAAARAAARRPDGQLGRRLRLGGRRLDAAAPLPDPRLGGRLVLRRRVDADPRERGGASSECIAEDGAARGGRDRARSRRRAARRRTTRPLFALAMAARLRATRRRARRRWTRCRRCAARARTCSSSRRSSRASAAGAARCGARSARWYAAQPVDALAYQAVKYRQREGVTHRDLLRLAHPAAARERRQPDARRLGRARSPVRVDRPRRRRPTACRAWSRASSAPRRRRRRARRPRSSASTACRARRVRAGAPDLGRRSGRRCSRTCR